MTSDKKLHFTPGRRLFFWGVGATGDPSLNTGGLVMTAERCIGCLCCGNAKLGYTACRFNRNSKIVNYVYRGYLGGALKNTFIGTRDFPKRPRDGGSLTGPSGAQAATQNCCFCQEYLYTEYNQLTGGIISQYVTEGAGTGYGFCYTLTGNPPLYHTVYPGGWWDGNEAGQTEGCTGSRPPIVSGVPCFKPPCRYGTFFACGVCKGFIYVRYYYNCPPPPAPPSSGLASYADVYFTVVNPDCDEWNYGDTVAYMDFASEGNSSITNPAWGQNTGVIPWLTGRGAEPSSTQYQSADRSLFISGVRSTFITAPAENYTDLQIYMPLAGQMSFYVYRTSTGTLSLTLTDNGSTIWTDTDPTQPAADDTWVQVTLDLAEGNHYLKFTSTHDSGNAATDGFYIDTMEFTT